MAFQRALAIAQREKDAAMEMRTLANGSIVDLYHLHYEEGLDKSEKAIEMARRVDAPQDEAVAYYSAANFMLMLGDSNGSRLHAAAGLVSAEKVRDRSWLSRILWANETVFFLQGGWEAARDFNDRALLTVWSRDPRILFFRAALESGLGDFEGGEVYIDRLVELMQLTPPGPFGACDSGNRHSSRRSHHRIPGPLRCGRECCQNRRIVAVWHPSYGFVVQGRLGTDGGTAA